MKIGIYGGVDAGPVCDQNIEYVAVDKGVEYLLQQGIKPIIVIGDMDSLQNQKVIESLNIKKYSCIKDDTDTALAIHYALERGYDEIDLYGVTKKRQDHFLAVLCLLKKYQDISITIYDEYNKIFLLKPGSHQISKDGYKYFSLFALTQSTISLRDCHYPLEQYNLRYDDPLCVSNEMNDDYVIVENSEPVIFLQTN